MHQKICTIFCWADQNNTVIFLPNVSKLFDIPGSGTEHLVNVAERKNLLVKFNIPQIWSCEIVKLWKENSNNNCFLIIIIFLWLLLRLAL